MKTKGKEKILYYLGAGASAGPTLYNEDGVYSDFDPVQALPIAKTVGKYDNTNEIIFGTILGLPHALRNLANKLKKEVASGDYPEPYFSQILNAFYDLANKGEEFGNVDTYAKHLQINGAYDLLEKLKRTLSLYFAIEQACNQKLDRRYRNWLIGIMDTKTFPENIKILSWNYDFQVQITASEYQIESFSSSRGGVMKKSPPLIEYCPEIGPSIFGNDDFSLIHLNGIAGLFLRPEERIRYHVYTSSHLSESAKMIRDFQSNTDVDDFHFAWETSDYHERLLKSVKKMIGGTTIMVVIGYSFPFLNRAVDKEVFGFLKEEGTLKKIYYQDPKLDGQQLLAQFGLEGMGSDFEAEGGFSSSNIIHIPDVSEFHIPFEF